MQSKQLTLEEAFEIQKEHIEQWKPRLSYECYNDLMKKVELENSLVTKDTSPYDVFRGCNLSNFIENWKPNES